MGAVTNDPRTLEEKRRDAQLRILQDLELDRKSETPIRHQPQVETR